MLPTKPRSFAALAFAGAGWAYLVSKHFRLARASGHSMSPAINDRDLLFQEALTWADVDDLRVGDVITFKSPLDPDLSVTKRITGLPGDKVAHAEGSTVVPAGHLWVTGDNLAASRDSRHYGPISFNLMQYRVMGSVPLR